MSEPVPIRVFIAIAVPEEIKAAIGATQEQLRRALPRARIRWTRPEQFHLTLRFLGNVDAQRVPMLADVVTSVCKEVAPVSLLARGLGCFPNTRRPRVVWAGLDDRTERLGVLQRAIQNSTQEFTTEQLETNFSGHVTLARVKAIDRNETQILSRFVDASVEKTWGEFTVNHVELIQSELSEQGSQYRRLAVIPFI